MTQKPCYSVANAAIIAAMTVGLRHPLEAGAFSIGVSSLEKDVLERLYGAIAYHDSTLTGGKQGNL